jgi:hypothetical protein
MLGAIPIIADNRIRAAMEQGEFDHFAGAGQPLHNLDSTYDPNWWLRQMLQREKLTADDMVVAQEKLEQARSQKNS